MSATNCETSGCSGCPHCSLEMAAILADAQAGRFASLSEKMADLTKRTLRALGLSAQHPAAKFIAAAQWLVPEPVDMTKILRAGKPETPEERAARLTGTFKGSAAQHSNAPAPICQSEQNDRVRQLNKLRRRD